MPSWTTQQVDRYKALMASGRNMGWRDKINLCFPACKLSNPAPKALILDSESKLGRTLPADLVALLSESNGFTTARGDSVIEPIDYIISDTLDLWSYEDLYIAPKTMVAFGGPGDGDRYFFPILPNGEYKDEVYLWDHETDSRKWISQSLADFLYRTTIELDERQT
jgi:cell wall assembly regulator SMI1